MHAYRSRYHRVRYLNPSGVVSPPYVLDRKALTLTPYLNEEWVKLPSGLIVPTLRGGSISGRTQVPLIYIGSSAAAAGAQNTVALDSNYVAGTSGDAICNRMAIAQSQTLTALYAFIASYNGTAANVTDLNWEVRTGSSTAINTAGGGLVGSGTFNPATATGWVRVSGLSVPLLAQSGDNFYYLILGDADGNGTDFATVLQDHSNQLTAVNPLASSAMSGSTTNGWSAITMLTRTSCLLAVSSSGVIAGSPFSAVNKSSTSMNRRGLFLANGFPCAVKIFGITSAVGNANISGAEVIYANTPPGGPTLGSTTRLLSGANAILGGIFPDGVAMGANVPFRIVLTFAANSGQPAKAEIGSGADATLRAVMLGGGQWYWAEANGTTDWSNDDINAWPAVAILIEDFLVSGAVTTIT